MMAEPRNCGPLASRFALLSSLKPGKIPRTGRSLAVRYGLWSGVSFHVFGTVFLHVGRCSLEKDRVFSIVTMAGTAVGRETTLRVCSPDAVGKLHGWRPTKS